MMTMVRPIKVGQAAHQCVDAAGAVRVEAGGRFVEKQQLRVERQRARQRRAFEHAAAQFRGILQPGLRLQAGQGDLPGGDLIDQRVVEIGVFAQRQADVVQHVERAEQAAVLEHHAPALAQDHAPHPARLPGRRHRAPGSSPSRGGAAGSFRAAGSICRSRCRRPWRRSRRGAPRGRGRHARHGCRNGCTPGGSR